MIDLIFVVFLFCIQGIVSYEALIDPYKVCQSENHARDAHAYYIEGEECIKLKEFENARTFFRTAVRLCPENGEYWLRLGLAELRSGEREKSFLRLLQAKKLVPDLFNRESELVSFVQNFKRDPTPYQQHFPFLTEIDGETWRSLKSHMLSLVMQGPFVVRDAFPHKRMQAVFGLSRFNETYGSTQVEFYPQNMLTKPERLYNANFSHAINFLSYPLGAYMSVDASLPGTYIQVNMNATLFDTVIAPLRKFLPVKSFLNDLSYMMKNLTRLANETYTTIPGTNGEFLETSILSTITKTKSMESIADEFSIKSHWYMLLIGEKGSGMFNHTDNLPVGSWQMQLAGTKKWIICKPDKITSSNVPSIVDTTKKPLSPNGEELPFDIPIPKCHHSILSPGDLIYYPAGYYHQTKCESSPTVSLSGTALGPDVYERDLVEAIRKECVDKKLGYNFSAEMCKLVSSGY